MFYIEINELKRFISESIEAYRNEIEKIKHYDYNDHYDIEYMVNNACHEDFDYYWFFKHAHPSSLEYICTFKDKDFSECSHSATIKVIMMMEFVLAQFDTGVSLPFVRTNEADNFNCEEDYDESSSLETMCYYLDNEFPLIKRKCDFEYSLSGDKAVYDDLFMTLHIMNELVFLDFDDYFEFLHDCIESTRCKLLKEIEKP